jgi:peptide/nickel transport system permease protein
MLLFVSKRLLMTVVVVAIISVIAFSLVHLSGDPAAAMAGEGATAADVDAVRTLYGFDRPLYAQYMDWLGSIVRGDLGRSHYLRADVGEILWRHAPVTATLALSALGFALFVSIPLGVAAALRPNSLVDRIALSIAVAGQATPTFLFALAMIYVFGVYLGWLPISGSGSAAHYVMPAIALGYYATPSMMRLTRAGMLDALQADHVRTAQAFGLAPWRVVIRHALRHAIIPVVALSAVQLGNMLGGSIVIETVFSLRGVGYLAWQSIQRLDIQVMQAILLAIAVVYAMLTLLGDVLNALLDPRIRIS